MTPGSSAPSRASSSTSPGWRATPRGSCDEAGARLGGDAPAPTGALRERPGRQPEPRALRSLGDGQAGGDVIGLRERGGGPARLAARIDLEPADSAPTTVRELDAEAAADQLDRLYRAALGMCGSPQLAEDLVQETYFKVLSRPRLLRRSDELGYLIGALRHVWQSHLRARRARPAETELSAPERLVAAPGVGDPELSIEAGAALAALAALPEAFRAVVAAVDLAGLSYAECARALEIAEGTVMSRLSRGRARIIAALDGMDA
ncbi:MAG: sigma-70 family RNA polymerase sigma factor [Solirubrobacterales bacterium]|nr:sigma-70 family RNA polymerase sigma factor [Solirubrobacterales bacterium]